MRGFVIILEVPTQAVSTTQQTQSSETDRWMISYSDSPTSYKYILHKYILQTTQNPRRFIESCMPPKPTGNQ
ncbi:hypothetical protein NQ317_011287 [Molorchus minor]|uniref:Uncharacterized protein n=1 Tax=Molorchus minor TaxID=1323400 RepID=A0ABQ9JV12_9CUCU|nr:hypothetical protein NQ317_011287 [Molorchus minor]